MATLDEVQDCVLCSEKGCCTGEQMRPSRVVNGFVVYECSHCDPR